MAPQQQWTVKEVPPEVVAEKAKITKELSAIAAEFVPTGAAVVAAEDQSAMDAYSFGLAEGDYGEELFAENWWANLGEDAAWLGQSGDGTDVVAEQDLYMWDYCPGVDAVDPSMDFTWTTDASTVSTFEVPETGMAENATEQQMSEKTPNPRNYKTAPCWHFARGRCAMGMRCQFAHGEADMRKPGGVPAQKKQSKSKDPKDPSEDILTMCGAWGALTTRKPGVLPTFQLFTKSALLSYRSLVLYDAPPGELGQWKTEEAA